MADHEELATAKATHLVMIALLSKIRRRQMAHLTIKTIEERLAMMKRQDNMWAEKYVLDVGHLLKERKALHESAGKLREALVEYVEFVHDMHNERRPMRLTLANCDVPRCAAVRAVLAETGDR